MLNRSCPQADFESEPAAEVLSRTALGSAPPVDFNRLPGDEIERLITLCEAPSLLWRCEPAAARAPEPFGMIA